MFDPKLKARTAIQISDDKSYLLLYDILKALLKDDFKTALPGFNAQDILIRKRLMKKLEEAGTQVTGWSEERANWIFNAYRTLNRYTDAVDVTGKVFYVKKISENFTSFNEDGVKFFGGITKYELGPDADYAVFDHEKLKAYLDSDLESEQNMYVDEFERWVNCLEYYNDDSSIKFISENTLKAAIYQLLIPVYREIIDDDVIITITWKHFVCSNLSEKERQIIDKIEKQGGIIHDRSVKKADYLRNGKRRAQTRKSSSTIW